MTSRTAATLLARLQAPARAHWPAFRDGRLCLTHGRLAAATGALSRGLAESGIGPGDRVLVMLPDSAEHLVAVLALLALGAVAVPLDVRAGVWQQAQMVKQVRPRAALAAAQTTALDDLPVLHPAFDEDGQLHLEARPLPPAALQPAAVDEDQIALIRFSSGSSGRPKGVCLPHAQLHWSGAVLSQAFGMQPGHRELLVAPMVYSGAWQRVVATLWAGGCVVRMDGPPALPVLLENCEREGIHGFYTPPPLARLLLRARPLEVRAALARCRTLEIGSAPMGAQALSDLAALLPHTRLLFHYGMTECSRATLLDVRAHPGRLDTVGRTAPGVAVRVVDDRGQPVPAGTAGEIQLRGPQRALGYLGGAEFSPDGWLPSGDRGCLDEAGFLTFLGRLDERINCGGHSIQPAEVEAALGAVPGVRELLVAGVPDPRGLLGEVPWAFVVPEQPEGWNPAELMERARARLAPHQVPRGVDTLSALPLTPSGKPHRRRLVERHLSHRRRRHGIG